MKESFTALERSAIAAICSQSEFGSYLEAQMEHATVAARENTGAGFFTAIAPNPIAPSVKDIPRVIGNVWFRVMDSAGFGPSLFLLKMAGFQLWKVPISEMKTRSPLMNPSLN